MQLVYDAKIILENGTIFLGKFIGTKKAVFGDFIFNTAPVGYEEALTDPSYNQEILVMTFPIQGSYGISEKYLQSKKIQVAGFVVCELENHFSNFEGKQTLEEFLLKQNVSGIANVDTRALVKIIRENGSMRGAIVSINENDATIIKKLRSMLFIKHVEKITPNLITTKSKQKIKKLPQKLLKIGFIDYGGKQDIIKCLEKQGFEVLVFPHNVTFTELKKAKLEAIFFSNGPGNPAELVHEIAEIKKMIKAKWVLVGICLGLQLLALAMGAKVHRLKYGHHSINHPVKNLLTNQVFLTSQNHNYAIKQESLSSDWIITHVSLNDGSIEGLKNEKMRINAVQFHPEAAPGPLDTNEIFNNFAQFIKQYRGKNA